MCRTLIQELQEKCDGKARVGLGIPGVMSPQDGVVATSNILCLSGQSLQADLENAAGCGVTIGNDANCFALIEALHGAGKGFGVVLGVILGTGMGGGVVYQGRVWPGAQGLAGEWGHSTIDPQGVLCYCGRRGCQEQYISGTGIRRMYRERTGREKSAPEIHDHAKDGADPDAQAVMASFLELYAQALANLIFCFDPDAIVRVWQTGTATNEDILLSTQDTPSRQRPTKVTGERTCQFWSAWKSARDIMTNALAL